MSRSRSIKLSLSVILVYSIFFLLFISPSFASDETKAAKKSFEQSSQPSNAGDGSDEVTYKTIRVTMQMEAGAAQYKEWPGAKRTIHAGIGWIQPFGRAEYVAGLGFPEMQQYPKPSYFNDDWMKAYDTDLFCVYMLKDGNIYVYDGVVGNIMPAENDDGKMDYLINVIVGGTGAYEGATGMLLGETPGRGKGTKVSTGVSLPVSILKLLNGYIKIPVKK